MLHSARIFKQNVEFGKGLLHVDLEGYNTSDITDDAAMVVMDSLKIADDVAKMVI